MKQKLFLKNMFQIILIFVIFSGISLFLKKSFFLGSFISFSSLFCLILIELEKNKIKSNCGGFFKLPPL